MSDEITMPPAEAKRWAKLAETLLEERLKRWNALHPSGTPVRYHPVIGDPKSRPARTRGEAYLLSGHTPVVFLVGVAGCVALDALVCDVECSECLQSLSQLRKAAQAGGNE